MRTLLNIVVFTVVLVSCSKKTDSGAIPKNARVGLQDVVIIEGLTYLKSSEEQLTESIDSDLEKFWIQKRVSDHPLLLRVRQNDQSLECHTSLDNLL